MFANPGCSPSMGMSLLILFRGRRECSDTADLLFEGLKPSFSITIQKIMRGLKLDFVFMLRVGGALSGKSYGSSDLGLLQVVSQLIGMFRFTSTLMASLP
jgi:hypothetical protein